MDSVPLGQVTKHHNETWRGKNMQDELLTFGILLLSSPATTVFIRLLEVQGSS